MVPHWNKRNLDPICLYFRSTLRVPGCNHCKLRFRLGFPIITVTILVVTGILGWRVDPMNSDQKDLSCWCPLVDVADAPRCKLVPSSVPTSHYLFVHILCTRCISVCRIFMDIPLFDIVWIHVDLNVYITSTYQNNCKLQTIETFVIWSLPQHPPNTDLPCWGSTEASCHVGRDSGFWPGWVTVSCSLGGQMGWKVGPPFWTCIFLAEVC